MRTTSVAADAPGAVPAPGPDPDGAVNRPAVLAVVAVVVVAEAGVAFVSPLVGAVAHALLLVVLLARWVLAGDEAVLVLALLPFARLTSLALTPGRSGVDAYVLTALPLAVAVVWMLRRRLTGSIAGTGRPTWHGGAIALSGVPLGLLLHSVAELPVLPDPSSPTTLMLATPVVFLTAGVLEEVVYRGLVQRALARHLGSAAFVVTAILFTAAYLPSRDPAVLAVIAPLGLAFGWYVARTGRVASVAVAHGLMAAGALVVWPGLA